MSNNNGGKIMFAGLLGALAGAIGGLLFAPKSGEKTREDIAKLANRISKELKSGVKETESRAKEVFGKASKEALDKYQEVSSAVAGKVAKVKSAGDEINKEKYVMIVEEVLNDFKDDFESTKNGYSKMLSLLKSDWDKVKSAIVAEVKPVKKSLKKKSA